MQEIIHDDFFENFTVVTATASAIEYVPENSGIYAFYHAFDFSGKALYEDVENRIKSTVFKTKFKEENNRSKFIVDTRGESTSMSGSICDFIESISLPRDRRMLARSLIFCSILQQPDYIGTATNLRQRFRQHLERDDGFFEKYAQEKTSDEFLFVCFPCASNMARKLESLLIQLCQPKSNYQRS